MIRFSDRLQALPAGRLPRSVAGRRLEAERSIWALALPPDAVVAAVEASNGPGMVPG
jgi:hypothetical protein